jgi:hypothetical protein
MQMLHIGNCGEGAHPSNDNQAMACSAFYSTLHTSPLNALSSTACKSCPMQQKLSQGWIDFPGIFLMVWCSPAPYFLACKEQAAVPSIKQQMLLSTFYPRQILNDVATQVSTQL